LERRGPHLRLLDSAGLPLAEVERGPWLFALHILGDVAFLQLYTSQPPTWHAYAPPYGVRRRDATELFLFTGGSFDGFLHHIFPYPLPKPMALARERMGVGGRAGEGWTLPTPWRGLYLTLSPRALTPLYSERQ